MSSGRNELIINTMIPVIRTATVFPEHPFHSLRMMPQTLENVTFNAMSMHQLKVISDSDEVRKPFPRLSPKNWLYQSRPARAQKSRLEAYTLPFA